MKVVHRIIFHPKHHPKLKKRFMKLGVELKESFMRGDPKYSLGCHFDISEDDPLWHVIESILLSEKIGFNPTWTEFTKKEVLSAEWVCVNPKYFEDDSFPEPHGERISWRKASFDYKDECSYCGVGLYQNASIRLKGDPVLKDNDFVSIFRVYSIFARNKIFDILSQNGITGYEAYPGIHHKKDLPLETVKQLRVIGELASGIIDDNLRRADAERMNDDNSFTHEPYPCGHVKYIGLSCGMYRFHRDIFKDMPDLVKTHEWFGSGHEAVQLMIASAKFARLYLDKGWKGLNLSPIELV